MFWICTMTQNHQAPLKHSDFKKLPSVVVALGLWVGLTVVCMLQSLSQSSQIGLNKDRNRPK